jgi:tripartite-type tricarboxylate transporter receptor subunit TctC
MGHPWSVENRPGAGGNIAAEYVVRSAADGHTLLQGFPGLAINPSLYAKLSYDPQKDLAPISLVSASALMLVSHPSLPVKSPKELIALAKARPGELHFPSAGNGTSSHMGGELFKAMAGINVVHVPYKGAAQGLLDLVSGRLHFMVNPVPEMLPYVQPGKLRGLAVTSAKRVHVVPDLPTIAEAALPGYEMTTWNGLVAPASTPREVVARLNSETLKALRTPDLGEKLRGMGLEILAGTPEQFAAFMRDETVKWARVVKASGARIE